MWLASDQARGHYTTSVLPDGRDFLPATGAEIAFIGGGLYSRRDGVWESASHALGPAEHHPHVVGISGVRAAVVWPAVVPAATTR